MDTGGNDRGAIVLANTMWIIVIFHATKPKGSVCPNRFSSQMSFAKVLEDRLQDRNTSRKQASSNTQQTRHICRTKDLDRTSIFSTLSEMQVKLQRLFSVMYDLQFGMIPSRFICCFAIIICFQKQINQCETVDQTNNL